MPTPCTDNCDNSCEALNGLYEKAVNLIAYSDLIKSWVNGPKTGTVNIAGTNVPTLLNIATTLKTNSDAVIANTQSRADAVIANTQSRADTLITNLQNQINGLPASIVQQGGGLSLDSNGKLVINFNDMPTDKFEAMLKSLRLPIWLTGNKDFFVNGATGSNTLDAGRGESAAKPFKTIQACINYIINNYNIGNYRATINIANGTYNENLVLSDFSRNNGDIMITSASGNRGDVRINCTLPRASTIVATAGKWRLSYLTIDLSPDMSQFEGTNDAYTSIILSQGKNSEVIMTGNNCRFLPDNGSPAGNYYMYAFRAMDGGTLRIEPASVIGRFDTNDLPNKVSVSVLQSSTQGLISSSGTNSAELFPGLGMNADYSTCAFADSGDIRFWSTHPYPPVITNSRTTAGRRYRAQGGGTINVGNRGADFFPGTADGTVDASTYSWYK